MNNQKKLFEEIHEEYQRNYFDKYSNYYKREIILKKIKKFFLNKKNILEVGCGGGTNFKMFLENKFIEDQYYAVDISKKAVLNFNKINNKNKNFKANLADFTQSGKILGKFDLIIFMGVLHHMTNDLDKVFDNIKNNLNENGIVLFIEPNANFLNFIRKIWYKYSSKFDHENERALYGHELDFLANKNNLKLINSEYFGNLGFFVILQSMILKTPKFIKVLTYRFLTKFDLFVEKILQNRFCLSVMVRVYKKNKL